MKLSRQLLLLGAQTPAQAYANRVLATSPLRYNKLNETGGTSIVDSSGNGYTGTWTGVDLANTDSPFVPDKAPFWDGANDSGNLYSAAFATAMNFNEFTIMLWVRMNALSVWSDASNRDFIHLQRPNATDGNIRILKSSTSNRLTFRRIGNGTTRDIQSDGNSDTGFFSVAFSCSVAGGGLLSAGQTRAYKNGVEVGTAQTGNVNAASSGMNLTNNTLGSVAAVNVHHGWLSHLIIWNRPIDAAILALMTP